MRFTVQKLQHDLVAYLQSAYPAPYSVRIGNDDKVYAAYTISTSGSVGYVRLTARFVKTGIWVDLDHWAIGRQEPATALLGRVALIKYHLISSMAPHEVALAPVLTNPVSRALGAASRWMESWISSAFRAA